MIRNGFTKKKVGTMTLGETLKKLRTDKRISLGEVARATKIQANYLEKLENGDYVNLPPDVYVKGFIRNYAEFLGLEDTALVRLYEKEKGIKNNLENHKNPKKENGKKKPINVSSFVFTPKKIAMSFIGILVLFGFFYLSRQLGSFSGAPQLIVLSPRQNEQVDGNLATVEGRTDKDANIFINDQPVMVSDDGKFRENLTLNSGVNVINVRAVNRFNKEEKETLTISSNYLSPQEQEAPAVQQPEGEQEKAGEMEMELRVDPGPVWLSVETDGNTAFSGTMLSGSVQIFHATEKIVVNSGQGSATYIKFNGKDIGTLGQDPGAIRGVTFTKDTKY